MTNIRQLCERAIELSKVHVATSFENELLLAQQAELLPIIATECLRLMEENVELKALLKQVSETLDGIKYEVNWSVYTCEDDEFAQIFYCRDVIDICLKRLGEAPEEGGGK